VGNVFGGEGAATEGAGDGLDAGVAKLAVRQAHFRAGVKGGGGGGRWGWRQDEVTAAGASADGRAGGARVDGVCGCVDDEAEALVRVEADEEGEGVVV